MSLQKKLENFNEFYVPLVGNYVIDLANNYIIKHVTGLAGNKYTQDMNLIIHN